MKENRARFVLPAVLLLGFICTAAPPASSTTPSLNDTFWQLLKFTGSDGKTLTPTDPARYTISFDNGAFSMRVDCNRGRGSWESSGPNRLKFGPLLLTRAMCPPDPLNDRVAKDWNDVRSYTIKDNHLFLSLKASGGTYEFEPMFVLENTHWKLTHLGDAEVTQPQRTPYLVLNPNEHRVTGSGGCNSFAGSYELNGNHLEFAQRLSSTMMMCGSDMEIETGFLNALSKVKTWTINGRQLDLADADGRHVLASLEATDQ